MAFCQHFFAVHNRSLINACSNKYWLLTWPFPGMNTYQEKDILKFLDTLFYGNQISAIVKRLMYKILK